MTLMQPQATLAPDRPYRAVFRAFGDGDPNEYSLYDVLYRSPVTGSLLEVHHDVDVLRQRTPAEWRALFESRVGELMSFQYFVPDTFDPRDEPAPKRELSDTPTDGGSQ